MAFQPLENYGVIGNMRSIALVGMNGSIDFLCYPDFDSPRMPKFLKLWLGDWMNGPQVMMPRTF